MGVFWAYIFEQPGADPVADRIELETEGQRTALVPVGDVGQAVEVARRLVGEGVQLLELCGGFGAIDVARVVASVEGRVPVGSVAFAFDSLTQAAAYKARTELE